MKSIGKRITKSRFGFFPTHTHHKRASQLYTQLGVGAGYFLIYFIAQHPTPPLPPPKRSLAWTELQQTRAVHTHVRVPLSFLISFFLQFFFFFCVRGGNRAKIHLCQYFQLSCAISVALSSTKRRTGVQLSGHESLHNSRRYFCRKLASRLYNGRDAVLSSISLSPVRLCRQYRCGDQEIFHPDILH